jgi:hypothetical protein
MAGRTARLSTGRICDASDPAQGDAHPFGHDPRFPLNPVPEPTLARAGAGEFVHAFGERADRVRERARLDGASAKIAANWDKEALGKLAQFTFPFWSTG